MGKSFRIGKIVVLCAIGGVLLLWPYHDDRSLWWRRSHLEIVDRQLHGLKDLLQDHKNTHGRYPTNDEGLAALDNFESRFTLSYYPEPEEARWRESSGFCGYGRFWWLESEQALKEFRHVHGRAPRDQGEFCETRIGWEFRDWEPINGTEQRRTETVLAIDRHNNIFLLNDAGVFSPWLLPYNYENRNGSDAAAFRQSPVGGDRWGCSLQVDDGVYIFSSGGYVYAQELRQMWWRRNGPRFVGILLITLGIAAAVTDVVRTKYGRPLLGILAVVPGFLFGGAMFAVNATTCYIMSPLFSRRSPEMVSFQMRLLDKYRESGVIDEETYQRALSATRQEQSESDDESEDSRQ